MEILHFSALLYSSHDIVFCRKPPASVDLFVHRAAQAPSTPCVQTTQSLPIAPPPRPALLPIRRRQPLHPIRHRPCLLLIRRRPSLRRFDADPFSRAPAQLGLPIPSATVAGRPLRCPVRRRPSSRASPPPQPLVDKQGWRNTG